MAVVGGSGSGKTWLAEAVVSALAPGAARVSLDDFYRDLSHIPEAERDQVNFDDPSAIDWEKFREIMAGLRRDKTVPLPVYDFATHTRQLETREFSPPAVVVWDGLWLLHHDPLREMFAVTVFVDCGVEERFRRRAERDMRERGRSLESIRRQFFAHVEPMHERFVEPQRSRAGRVVNSPLGAGDMEDLLLELHRAQA
jgi:uridine kinase